MTGEARPVGTPGRAGIPPTINELILAYFNFATAYYGYDRDTRFPEECRILEIVGDKTAVVLYRITFHTTDCGNYVWSNRWCTTSHTGPEWLTTRVTRGRNGYGLGPGAAA